MFRRISDIVKELVLGIFAVDLLIAVIGLVFVPQKAVFSLGVLMGFIVAVIMIFSMHSSIEKAMDFEGKGATFQCVKGYIFRTVFLIAGFVVAYLLGMWAVLAYFLGVMSIKAAAYLQPHTKKFLHHM